MRPAGDPPVCECHRLPMLANGGGKWACQVKRRASKLAYYYTDKGQDAYQRYRASAKGRATNDAKNKRRMYVGAMYLGLVGFTDSEAKEMINGATD